MRLFAFHTLCFMLLSGPIDSGASDGSDAHALQERWAVWLAAHGDTFDAMFAEQLDRSSTNQTTFDAFRTNNMKIVAHNSRGLSHTKGHNVFSGMTKSE